MTKNGRLIAFLLGSVPFALLVTKFNFLCDDAFIVFRYAENFAEGLGLRYNLGESPPVEGYANFLWIMMMAGGHSLGFDLLIFSRVLSIACGGALLWSLSGAASRWANLGTLGTFASVLFLGTFAPFAVWSTGGLGTLFSALLGFLAFAHLHRGTSEDPDSNRVSGIKLGLLFLLIVLARAEGWFTIIVLLITKAQRICSTPHLRRSIGFAIGIALLGTFGHTTFRYLYYGELLPHTAHVKVAFSWLAAKRGFYYTVDYFLSYPIIPLVIISSLFVGRQVREKVAFPCVLMISAYAIYAVLTGGDFMCMWRFLVPSTPYAALLVGVLLKARVHPSKQWIVIASISCVLALNIFAAFNHHVVPRSVRERLHYNWNMPLYLSGEESWRMMVRNTREWSLLGKALEKHTHKNESITWGAIGAVGYYSGLFVYDRQGLITKGTVQFREITPSRSPGHDIEVPLGFFMKDRPTYLAAKIIPLDKAEIPGEIVLRGGIPYEFVVHPLGPGFPENTGLQLMQIAKPRR